jgi:hypothetical protein
MTDRLSALGVGKLGGFPGFQNVIRLILAEGMDKKGRFFNGCLVMAAVEGLANSFLSSVPYLPVPSSLIHLFDENREIDVRLLPLKTLHGAVWLTDDAWVIQLNAREGSRERRFTLFHEAFHIVCRNVSPAFRRNGLTREPFREALADHFADCILMPREWILNEWQNNGDARKMAVLFDVPLTAMKRRLRQLNVG